MLVLRSEAGGIDGLQRHISLTSLEMDGMLEGVTSAAMALVDVGLGAVEEGRDGTISSRMNVRILYIKR